MRRLTRRTLLATAIAGAGTPALARGRHAGGGIFVPPMGMPLVTSTPSAGSTQNNDLLVGFQLTVVGSNITVSALGRWKETGDTHTHTIYLYDVTAASVIPGGSVSVNMTGPPANAFAYVNLGTPLTLLAGRAYYLLSAELAAGDPFLNAQAITVTADASVPSAIYMNRNFTGINAFPSGSMSQGAVNLLYTVGGAPNTVVAGSATPPITLSAQSPPSTALRQDGYLVLGTNVLAGTSQGATGKVVSGTLTIGGTYSYGNGGGGPVPGPGEIVIQPLVDGVPFGGLVTGGLTMSWTLDTTMLSNGTHSIGAKAVSTSTPLLRTSAIGWLPLTLIVSNPPGTLSTGPQTVPVTMWNTNGQDSTERFFPTLPDFVTFPGIGSLPFHNTAYDYPDLAPAPSSDPMYRIYGNFYQESVSAPFRDQYDTNNFFQTTQFGGVFASPYNGQFVLDIFGSYDQVKNSPLFDGHRCDNSITAYSTYREYPDGHGWIAASLDGTVYEQKYTGQRTTVWGLTANRSVLGIDQTDLTLSDAQIDATRTMVGTISTGGVDARGLQDICFDPRDISDRPTGNFTARIDPSGGPTSWLMTVTVAPGSPIKPGMYIKQSGAVIGYVSSNQSGSGGLGTYNVRLASTIGPSVMTAGFSQTIYLAKTIDHCILKVDLATGIGALYAGPTDSSTGFNDGPATGLGVAHFNQPFGVCCGTDGTLYIGDTLNGAIRTVDPTGTTVSTLIGNQQPPPNFGGTVTYPTSGTITMTYVSTTAGVATINVVMPGMTILTGQTRAGKGCAVHISGVINSGTADLNNTTFDGPTAWFLNGFTDSQHFSIAVTVGTATVGTISGTIQLIAYNNDFYSPPGTVSYAGGASTQYALEPQALDFDSQGRLVFGETGSACARRIDLGAQTITRLGWCALHSANPSGQGFMWLAVDSDGCVGPVDDMILTSGDQGYFRISQDSTYQAFFANEFNFAFGEGAGAPGYPWDIAISHQRGRFIINGISQDAGPTNSSRIRQMGDPPLSIDPPTNWDSTGWNTGEVTWEYGTIPTFPWNSRPSFKSLMGTRGNHYLGAGVLPTFADLMVNSSFGSFASTTPGDAGDVNLANYILAGMGGSVPRPEFYGVTNRWMQYLIYFIRRSTLAGSYPTPVTLAALNPDYVPPYITVTSAIRNSSTSVTVTFTTDKPCFCVLNCGTPHDAALGPGLLPIYGQYAIESGTTFGTSHSITASGLANIQPTNYSITANDQAGNSSHTTDATIA